MKFKIEELRQLRTNFASLDSWLRVRTEATDILCTECEKEYRKIGKPIALIIPMDIYKPNIHICDDCARKYIELGMLDTTEDIKAKQREKETLLNEFNRLKYVLNLDTGNRYSKYLGIERKTNSEIKEIVEELKAEESRRAFLENIDTPNWFDYAYVKLRKIMYNLDPRTIKRNIKSFLYWRKIIFEVDWFDYGYLLDLMKHQLELMHKNWHKSHHVGWEEEKKQIETSIKLLDKYLESTIYDCEHEQEWLEEFLDSLKVMKGWWD